MSEGAPDWLRQKAALHGSEGALVRSLSKKQRQEYYAFVGRRQRPLFDDNYDDTVCLDERHRQAMIAYVHDNPRRALLQHLLPDVLRRCLHVQIGRRSYGAFGNLFLLRWPRKVQVMCHRRHPVSHVPYEQTDDYTNDRSSLLILAPWDIDTMDAVNGIPSDSDYSRFHNLNALAAEICAFDGEARIIADK
jgi:hypothetical protein